MEKNSRVLELEERPPKFYAIRVCKENIELIESNSFYKLSFASIQTSQGTVKEMVCFSHQKEDLKFYADIYSFAVFTLDRNMMWKVREFLSADLLQTKYIIK